MFLHDTKEACDNEKGGKEGGKRKKKKGGVPRLKQDGEENKRGVVSLNWQ